MCNSRRRCVIAVEPVPVSVPVPVLVPVSVLVPVPVLVLPDALINHLFHAASLSSVVWCDLICSNQA